jgi:hypothetical protein
MYSTDPISDAEWEALKEAAPWLAGTSDYSETDLREALDDYLNREPIAADILRSANPNVSSPDDNPMFLIRWMRVIEADPGLDTEQDKQAYWDAYWNRQLTLEQRHDAQETWEERTQGEAYAGPLEYET